MRLRWFPAAIGCATLALATFISPTHCLGQGTKPKAATTEASSTDDDSVVVVAISSLDSIIPNIQHLARTAGQGAAAGGIATAINQYSSGLDRTRPLGVFLSLDESGNPIPVGCLPVSDLEAFFDQLSIFGEANDLGDGLYELNIGNPIYAKKVGEWLYVAQTEDALSEIEDLGSGLAKLVAKYDIRVQINPQNIPEEALGYFMGQLKAGLAQAAQVAQQGGGDEEDAENARQASEQSIDQLQETLEATEKVMIGIAINKAEKKTLFDFGSQFVADSKQAKQIDTLKSSKAAFTGIPQESSMLNLNVFQLIEADQIAQFETQLSVYLKTAFNKIEESAKDSASADKIKDFVNRAVDIIVESAKLGKFETAVDTSVESALGIVAAFSVADGSKVEGLAADIAKEVAKEKGPFQIQLNTGKQSGFNLHKASLKLPPEADDAARKVWGDTVNFAIGTSPKAVIVSVGKNADAGLKSAIERAVAKPTGTAEATKMRFVLSQLLNYIQTIESTPVSEAMLNAATPGNDRILVDSQLIPRGLNVRLTLEDGVIKAISSGVKAGQQGGF